MTNMSLLKVARTVLEGHHGFQHSILTQTKALKELTEACRKSRHGGLVILHGTPGCGITTVLEQFKLTQKHDPLWPRCEQFFLRATLIDHVLDCAGLRNYYDFTTSVPAGLIEYASISGRRTIIFDGLEDYMTIKYDYSKIVSDIHRLVSCAKGFFVVVTTHDKNLLQKCRALKVGANYEIMLVDGGSHEELENFMNCFWSANNERFGKDLCLTSELKALAMNGRNNETVSSLLSRIELLYAGGLIGLESSIHTLPEFEILEWEVWNALYS
ncbi:hypothetical protein F6476_13555 [Pseudomonas umsongensis]|uniref:hypothetical protein n=1 Tax=Pseudomonas umsongensis TaxID=198618 RepID=UPI001245E769|nr:hypothetical protein [Pseudomonas umsongensis]QFG30142.1 hypothetical protein F6476_13555 [Pseudomonas umsongensis]